MSASLLAAVRAAAAGTPSGAGRPAGADAEEAPAGMVPAAPSNAETAEALHTWLTRYKDHIGRRLPSHVEPAAFLAAVRDRLPALSGCSPASILDAVLTCASFGFVPDGREAVLTREGALAQFIPTYRGYIKAMHNSGVVTSVRVEFVYEGDEFVYEPTAPAPLDLTHRPNLSVPTGQRGEPKYAYAFAWLRGGDRSQPVILRREDGEEIRDTYSKAYQRAVAEGRSDSFWHTDFWAMTRKSALRRLVKVVPTTAELRALEAVDEAADEQRPQLDHAPDPETAELVGEAVPLPRKRSAARRSQPKRTSRKGRKTTGRGRAR